ncbi:hypothetical protein JL720_6793 [Aureococcus anophagefferens]|nr:hypothetical protein JL720_6793 [Aureococcus anophagefferens]
MAASSLGSALGDANYTELAPYAYRHLAATRANRTDGSSGVSRAYTVDVVEGELRVDFRMGDAVNGTRYVAPAEGTLPGVHLLEKDVVKLQKIAKRYGAFLARSDVFAVIDVPAGPSWPGDRWIWASNEVYLELPPPTLEALSFEVIRPRVARYRVYEELAKILTPSGQPYLKGQLVRVRKRNALSTAPPRRVRLRGRRHASADFSRTVMRGRGWHAFYASIALAFFATLYALVVGSRYLSAMQTLADQSSKIQMRLTKTSAKNVAAAARDDDEDDAEDGKTGAFKEAADDADAAAQREEQEEASALAKEAEAVEAELKQLGEAADAVVADDEEGDGGDLQDWGGIMTWAEGLVLKDVVFLLDLVKPLMRPLATVDTAVVAPLRRSLIDARAKFVRMRCVLDADAMKVRGKGGGKVAPADESRTCFRTFVHAHTDFCFKKNLSDAGVDRPSLQRYLVATHDLRFKVHRMPKVRGRAWKKAWIPATKRSRKPFVSHGTIFAQGAAFFEASPSSSATAPWGGARASWASSTRTGAAGLPAVDLREHFGWLADEFDLAVETEMKLSVDGLRLRNFAAGGKKLKLSGSFYVEHVLTAVAHFACLVVPVVLLCSVAMHLQLRHSKLWAAVVGDGAERFWSIYDATLAREATQKRVDGATGLIQAAEASAAPELSDAAPVRGARRQQLGRRDGGRDPELAAVAALPELDDAKLAQIFAYADADSTRSSTPTKFDRVGVQFPLD